MAKRNSSRKIAPVKPASTDSLTRSTSRKKDVDARDARSRPKISSEPPKRAQYRRKHPQEQITRAHRTILDRNARERDREERKPISGARSGRETAPRAKQQRGGRAGDIFERVIHHEIPVYQIYEDDSLIAFLDARPLAPGHTLVVPKEYARTLDELSDESGAAIGRLLPRLARAIQLATGIREFNILQNNGAGAHQVVQRVHFHIIPKEESRGLGIDWPAEELEPEEGWRMMELIRRAFAAKRR